MLKKFVLFSFLFASLLNEVSFSQWVNYSDGIFGKHINYIFSDGSNVYAGTKDDGIYRSFDSGENWAKASSGIADNEITVIIKTNIYIFAGTKDSGIFRSSDNGSNWIPVNIGLTNRNIKSFTFIDNKIFTGTGTAGVFVSTNNGDSWVQSNTGLANLSVNTIFVNNENIFLGSGNGIYRSTNNGNNWINISNNLPSNTSIKTITVSGTSIFAGTVYGGGIFRSTNGGLNWLQINNGFPEYPVIYSLQTVSDKIFAASDMGVYKSTDSGELWEEASEGLYYPVNLNLSVNGNIIYSATEVGIFKSTDAGLNWLPKNKGIPPAVPVKSVFVNGNDIYAGTDGNGIFKSVNNGLNWSPINNGLKAFDIESMVIKDGIFFASTTYGIFKSTDNGESWRSCFPPKLVYTLIKRGNYVIAGICSCSGGGVVRTSDYGETWEYVIEGLVNPNVNVLEQTSDKIFAGTSDGIFYTTNFGDNWITCNSGLPTNNIISSMTVSGDTVYLGTTENGVFYSLNNNIQWNSISDGLQQGVIINSIKCFSGNLIASTPLGIYYKSNSTPVWIPVNQGLMNNDMDAIAIKDNFAFIGSGLLAKNGIWRRPLTEITSVKKTNTSIIPTGIILYGNYPNPFNSMTNVKFQVTSFKFVKLVVLDILGREIVTLVNEKLQPGVYEVRFDAGDLPSGIYFLKLSASGYQSTHKITLLK